MVEVEVEYDYEAKEPDELTLKKGDIIRDVVPKQDGWFHGSLNGQSGMFPDNFVKVMDSKGQQPVVLRNKKDVTRIRKCRVIFSYNQDHEDELNLKVGDIIDIVGEEEEGWWRGLLNGKEGVFPSNFVEEMHASNTNNNNKTKQSSSKEDLSETLDKPPPLLPKAVKQLCEVKYAYKAQNEDELNLKQGDIVTIVNKDGPDPGWWKGELSGKIGLFPDNFVVLLKSDETGEEKQTAPSPTVAIKPSSIVTQQRKSLEIKSDSSSSEQKTPPVPGKKPSIPLKKSPSNSSSGGLFSDLKKKIADVVDGATGSKPAKTEPPHNNNNNNDLSRESENVFDQVERRPLLHDVRANRVKAPGRRLPSQVFKDDEEVPSMLNGNGTEEKEAPSVSETDGTPIAKPKLREWEKHKAPWLEEMKQNQMKRTSTSPVPAEPKLRQNSEESKPISANYENVQPIGLKTPPNELEKTSPVVRTKPIVPTPNSKPVVPKETPLPAAKPKVSPSSKSPIVTPIGKEEQTVSLRQYSELVGKIERLEALIEKQNAAHQTAIEELKGKLQLETDMRILMQAELEKVSQQVLHI